MSQEFDEKTVEPVSHNRKSDYPYFIYRCKGNKHEMEDKSACVLVDMPDNRKLTQQNLKTIMNEVREKYHSSDEKRSEEDKSGSTLVCAIATQRQVLLANVGDSSAFLLTRKPAQSSWWRGKTLWHCRRINDHHDRKNAGEITRITQIAENSNIALKSVLPQDSSYVNCIENGKIIAGLSPTRSFESGQIRKCKVISDEPEMYLEDIAPGNDAILVLTSDCIDIYGLTVEKVEEKIAEFSNRYFKEGGANKDEVRNFTYELGRHVHGTWKKYCDDPWTRGVEYIDDTTMVTVALSGIPRGQCVVPVVCDGHSGSKTAERLVRDVGMVARNHLEQQSQLAGPQVGELNNGSANDEKNDSKGGAPPVADSQGDVIPAKDIFLDFSVLPPDDQAEAILKEVQAIVDAHPDNPTLRVGLTYSANLEQTTEIQAAREQRAKLEGAEERKEHAIQFRTNEMLRIGGAGQAIIMNRIYWKLQEPQWQRLKKHFEILPITTIPKGQRSKSVTVGQLNTQALADLAYIKSFAASGNAVLLWKNQDTREDGNYAIGGGVSKGYKVKTSPETLQHIKDELVKLKDREYILQLRIERMRGGGSAISSKGVQLQKSGLSALSVDSGDDNYEDKEEEKALESHVQLGQQGKIGFNKLDEYMQNKQGVTADPFFSNKHNGFQELKRICMQESKLGVVGYAFKCFYQYRVTETDKEIIKEMLEKLFKEQLCNLENVDVADMKRVMRLLREIGTILYENSDAPITRLIDEIVTVNKDKISWGMINNNSKLLKLISNRNYLDGGTALKDVAESYDDFLCNQQGLAQPRTYIVEEYYEKREIEGRIELLKGYPAPASWVLCDPSPAGGLGNCIQNACDKYEIWLRNASDDRMQVGFFNPHGQVGLNKARALAIQAVGKKEPAEIHTLLRKFYNNDVEFSNTSTTFFSAKARHNNHSFISFLLNELKEESSALAALNQAHDDGAPKLALNKDRDYTTSDAKNERKDAFEFLKNVGLDNVDTTCCFSRG